VLNSPVIVGIGGCWKQWPGGGRHCRLLPRPKAGALRRDLLLNAAGDVKISDFAISSQLANTSALCETFVGTTCYMSPERLSGDPYSYAADIWAFGLIVLELAIGSYPYTDADGKPPSSYFQLLGFITDHPAPTVPAGRFSELLTQFIALCLDKAPLKRPSARELLKHPWLRQRAELDPGSVRGREDRLDSPSTPSSLERSRSKSGLQLDETLANLKLGDD